MFIKAVAISGLAAVSSAHMLMTNPVPYGASTLNNSPLLADGSDFPCKVRDGMWAPAVHDNIYAQGSEQSLAFKGTATHGGGSCQVSVTTDLKPDQKSVWKVLKSFEGGCPARDQIGNMGNNPEQIDPYKYNFTIPNELSAGKYTLAWTWFNKVGNREMYMNCAPLTVTGKDTGRSFWASLPDMFIANIKFDGQTCTVPADVDLKFPNAGTFLSKYSGKGLAVANFWAPDHDQPACMRTISSKPGGTKPASKPADTKPAPKQNSKPSSTFVKQSAPKSAAAHAPQGSDKPPTSHNEGSQRKPLQAAAPAPLASAGQGDAGDFMTIATPTPSPASSPGSAPTTAPGSSTTHPAGQKCTQEGLWNCVDGLSFQRCASGQWSVVMQLAAGVGCAKGESNDFPVSALPVGAGGPARRRVRIIQS